LDVEVQLLALDSFNSEHGKLDFTVE